MTFYATIDTNVLLSGVLKPKSGLGTLVLECIFGKLRPVLDKKGLILEEYNEVLSRPEFNFDPSIVEMIITGMEKRAITVVPRKIIRKKYGYYYFPDETDIKFFTVTLGAASRYNTRLVTGNIKHFPERKFIKTPREMLQLIKSDSPERNLELIQIAHRKNFFKGFLEMEKNAKLENISQTLSIKRISPISEIHDNDMYYER